MTEQTPEPTQSIFEQFIRSGVHFGRKKSVFHPKMGDFVYLTKDNINIIDVTKTSEMIEKAAKYLAEAIKENKLILFVGVTKQSEEAVRNVAVSLEQPFVVERWLGGTITNFKVITSRIKYLEKLEEEKKSGGLEKYTKKERLLKNRELESLLKKYGGLRKLTRVPDVLFVSSATDSMTAIREARHAHLPIVGIVNTDSDPSLITYPIPANDNSKKSIEIVVGRFLELVQK